MRQTYFENAVALRSSNTCATSLPSFGAIQIMSELTGDGDMSEIGPLEEGQGADTTKKPRRLNFYKCAYCRAAKKKVITVLQTKKARQRSFHGYLLICWNSPGALTSRINLGLIPFNRNPNFIGRSAILQELEHQLMEPSSQLRAALFGLGGVGNMQAASKFTSGRSLVKVEKMEVDESRQLLCANLKGSKYVSRDLDALLSRLEYLPLALAQAAAFIQENDISVSEYLQLFDESDHGLIDLLGEDFQTIGRDLAAPHAVVQTWICSFEQINRQNALAGEILSLMSFYDQHNIPLEFMSYYIEQQPNPEFKSKLELTKALGILKAFSFIEATSERSLNIHRLVQLVTHKWLTERGTFARFAGQALLVVSHAFPVGNFENRETCSKYLPHVYAVLNSKGTGSPDERAAKAVLLDATAGHLLYNGLLEQAELFQLQALQIHREMLGEDHPSSLTSKSNLASTYRNRGQWKEAELLEFQVMEIRKTILGADHPDTLKSISNLASTLWNQGRWREAEPLEVQVMNTRKATLGEDHPDTLISMANLASTYRSQGRWNEAELLDLQVVAKTKNVLGEEHPITLTSMASLASTFWMQGRWAEAESLEARVLETRKKVLGENHPSVLVSMANLGSIFCGQGRWKDAELLELQVIEKRREILGEHHPSTLVSMANLASTFWNQGRWESAESLEMQVMKIRKATLGDEHPDTLISMANLAFTYHAQGRFDDALHLMQNCLLLQQRVLGMSHPYTISALSAIQEWQKTSCG
ncbi:hypothetical protein S7711_09285 [Stachybotrys chartarum IBT 7711]|uniref:Kinesin light chain n=1 Tax=Stachybotrys chartarum (strain CBS 109288 / IBT 7711) TaxID=1280523 RepID=A0A084AJL5_STACB|nr:hypothetical protein S7711_09285 [Stachybotrys chartarum IBT 7711]